MDKLDQYRQHIQTILTRYGSRKPKQQDVENELIFDTTHDHYQLMGWNGLHRVYHSVMHFDIKDGSIKGRYCARVTATIQTTVHWIRCGLT